MAATYVTKAELRLNLGIGDYYTDAVVEEVCQSAEDILKSKLNRNVGYNYAHSNTATTGTLYFDYLHDFYVGQVVTVTGNGSKHNGSKTITTVSPYEITYNFTGQPQTATVKHVVVPRGEVAAETYVDYATVPEVREAAMMIAVDIWQARQASNAGGISPDFQPSPYRMGNTLMARVRGLIADYLAPGGLVG